jgi:hypothetical protein
VVFAGGVSAKIWPAAPALSRYQITGATRTTPIALLADDSWC